MPSANWLPVNTLTDQKCLCLSGDKRGKEKSRRKSIKLAPSSSVNSRSREVSNLSLFWERWQCLWGAIWVAPCWERPALINLGERGVHVFLHIAYKTWLYIYSMWANISAVTKWCVWLKRQNLRSAVCVCVCVCAKASAMCVCVCVICLSLPVSGTLWREEDSESAVKIRVIMTYWIRIGSLSSFIAVSLDKPVEVRQAFTTDVFWRHSTQSTSQQHIRN